MPKKSTTKTKKPVKRAGKVAKKIEEPVKETSYLNSIRSLTSKRTYYTLMLVVGLLIFAFLMSRFLVIAWVDKNPISRIQYFKELDKKYGKDMKEQLIVEKLLENEAKKKSVTVSQEEITQESKKIEDSQGGSQQLDQILEIQGMTRNDFTKLVRFQLLKQKTFGEGLNISDEDVEKYMETNKEQFKDLNKESSEAAKIRSTIKDQLKMQKINASFNKFLEENLNGPRVVRVK